MKPSLLMFSGDRDVVAGRRGPFYFTLGGLAREFGRIDVLTPRVPDAKPRTLHQRVHVHPSTSGRLRHASWLMRRASALASERRYHLIVSHDLVINDVICPSDWPKNTPIRSLSLEQVKKIDCGGQRNPRFPKQVPFPNTPMLVCVAAGCRPLMRS